MNGKKSKKLKVSEEFLSSRGFEKCPDGIWRKKDSAHPHTPSRSDPEPNQGLPRHRPEKKVKRRAEYRTLAIVTVRTVRPRDYDGLGASAKHYLDGLRHIGLFQDDSPEFFECACVSEYVGSFDQEETIIELYRIPENNSCESIKNA